MRKAGLLIAIGTMMAAVLLINGCDKNKSESKNAIDKSQKTTKLTIGVSLLTRTHPFYQDLEAGLSEAAKANGYDLIITAGEFDEGMGSC